MRPDRVKLLFAVLWGCLQGLAAAPASAQTYTSGSTVYSLINSSTHTKVGYNTAPYKFNASSGCGTAPPTLDDVLSDPIPIGFTFTFGITPYTTAYVMSNGRLQFGNTTCGFGTSSIGPPQTYPNGYPDASMNATMKIFGVDLDLTNLVDRPNYPSSVNTTPCVSAATCYVSVATLGSAPARQFVVTWRNVPEWVTASNTSGSFDLQIILNEDGTFVYQFGSISHGGTGSAQIGWQLTTSDYQVLSFGASTEPPPFTAIKFYLPAPLANYAFEEGAWAPSIAGQVLDSSSGSRAGTALGGAQTSSTGRVCRGAEIPLNTDASVDAVKTGLNLSDAALNLLGTGTITFWYRSNAPWSGVGAQDAQLLDATAISGQWFYLSKSANGVLAFVTTDSTGTVRSVSSAAQSFAANTWVHVAVTWNFNGSAAANSDALQVLVNAGTPVTSAFTSSGTLTPQIGILHLGDNALGAAGTLGTLNSANGFVDELQVYNYVLTQAQVNTVMATTRSCSSFNLDHLELRHTSGTSITCTPSTLTVRACADASCTSPYTAGVSGALTATGSPIVNWDGSTGNGAGARFAIPSGSSSITKNLQITTPGSELLGIAGLSPAPAGSSTCNFGSPACTMTASNSGFIFTVANHVAETSQSLNISAVRTADGALVCVPAFASTSKPVKLSCAYANPGAGTLPIRVGGFALNAAASAAAACDASGANLNLAFNASGVATTTLQYADVGVVTLAARYAPTTGTEAGLVMTGSTSFVARPAGFTVSNVSCTSMAAGQCAASLAAPGNNPAASSAAGAAFIPAGRAFSARISAVNAAAAVTLNFGRESAAESVLLTPALVLPSGGNSGTLSNATIAGGSFISGTATVSNLAYSEVGIITLTPSVADGDYLGAGAVSGSASGNIGRFIPAKFALSNGTVTHRNGLSCSPASTFSYLGENFRLGFSLTAINTSGTTTQNYTGSFAKLDPTVASGWNLAGLGGTTTFSVASGRLSLGSASGAWSNGAANGVTITANAVRATSPDGPFSAAFGIAPVDSDGVAMGSFDMASTSPGSSDRSGVATVALRFGRLRLSNAIGAADRALNLPVAAQSWTGSFWDTNTLDSCTTVPTSAISHGNLRRTLTVADLSASAGITLAAGQGLLRFAAPGGGRSGTFDIALSLGSSTTDQSCLQTWTPAKPATAGAGLAYLRGAWCGSNLDKDASARITFGLQRTQDNTVYRREIY